MAGHDAHYASTRKDKPCSLYPVGTHPINVNRSLRPHWENKRKRGKKSCTTPPTKPQALLFLTHASASVRAPPASPATTIPHPTSSPTLRLQPKAMRPGRAWQLATSPATNAFPKHPLLWAYQRIKPPHKPLMECASHFSECVNNFWLAGQTPRPGDVCFVCLGHVWVCMCLLLLVYIWIYLWLWVFFLFLHKARSKKALSFFHNLIRGYT